MGVEAKLTDAQFPVLAGKFTQNSLEYFLCMGVVGRVKGMRHRLVVEQDSEGGADVVTLWVENERQLCVLNAEVGAMQEAIEDQSVAFYPDRIFGSPLLIEGKLGTIYSQLKNDRKESRKTL